MFVFLIEIKTNIFPHIYRGSYMSAHVLLNLLNEFGKRVRCEAFLSVFPNEFNKFSDTGARVQDSI